VVEKHITQARADLRRTILQDLGWQLKHNVLYAPGEGPDDPSATRWGLAAAARKADLPQDVDDLHVFARALRGIYVRGSRGSSPAHLEEVYAAARAALSGVQVQVSRDQAGRPRAEDAGRTDASRDGRVTYPAVEAHITERADYLQDAEVKQALRLESELVQQFAQHLEEKGHAPSGVAVAVGTEVIRADLLDHTDGVLYEAKASPDRERIRAAIGQLYDYRRFIVPAPKLRVLLPTRPNRDLCVLLAMAGIGATWRDGAEWKDADPAALTSQAWC
jgi:hypothetical protein